eukprot:5974645-Alexandrium_andersonii.AAC.1
MAPLGAASRHSLVSASPRERPLAKARARKAQSPWPPRSTSRPWPEGVWMSVAEDGAAGPDAEAGLSAGLASPSGPFL